MCIKFCLFPFSFLRPLTCLYILLFTSLMLACRTKEEKAPVKAIKVKQVEMNAFSLIRNDDCLTCHSIHDKSAGPSYARISERYEADDATINRLADKIIAGGGGLWGGMMTKHPYLKKADAIKVVQWVLSLDDSLVNPNPMVNHPGTSLAKVFEEGSAAGTENGLMLSSYSVESLDDQGTGFPVIGKESLPTHSGIIGSVHLPDTESFRPLSDNVLLQAKGFLHIKTPGKYFIKQVRKGKGRVFLDGEKKINESDWDSETHVDLARGRYPIAVEYLPGAGEKSLSLQWITPDGKYYEVIPETAFTYAAD